MKIWKIYIREGEGADAHYLKKRFNEANKRSRLEKEVDEIFYAVNSKGNAIYCSNEFKVIGKDEDLAKKCNSEYDYAFTIDGDEVYAYDLNNGMYI